MKLATFGYNGRMGIGVVEGDALHDVSGVARDMTALIAMGDDGIAKVRAALDGAPRHPLSEVRLFAPVRPGKILCCGINYRSHAEENPDAVIPDEPFFFCKLPGSLAGPEDDIAIPDMSRQVDYEVEFSVVIGKRLDRAGEGDVMAAIFGYTLLNDVSARDVQFKDSQITLGKNFNGFAPVGPVIVTADALADPGDVRLMTRVNGKTLQDGTTADWVFPLPRLLSFLSHVMVLEPGDIVTTGTPAGVGFFQKPQVFLEAGDTVEIEAPPIGVLRNRFV